jgi:acyl carrier protein
LNRPGDASATVVRNAIAAVAPDRADELGELDPNIDIWAALDLDSVDHLAVMARLADELGRDIPERGYPLLLSLRQLSEYFDEQAG